MLSCNRSALAKGITLVESSRPDDQAQASLLVSHVLQHTRRESNGNGKDTFRIGISGSPGAGKSTFIEAMGTYLTDTKQQRVAVLAVDPSSSRSGGSILGDKTRMVRLASNPLAYVRPSPSRGTLGGVTRSTSDAIALCEGAGYSTIIVETVGVGQSEYAVADMVDMMVLLVSPGGGDELQGIKRGIVELADMIIVTKADGALLAAAKKAKADYSNALHLLTPRAPEQWQPRLLLCSVHEPERVAKAWSTMCEYREALKHLWKSRRAEQAVVWMWRILDASLRTHLQHHSSISSLIPQLEEDVRASRIPPSAAASLLVNKFLDR